MPNVFIFHGAYGTPEENWLPWVREELEKIGCKVFVPVFPTPKDQTLDKWLGVFEKFKGYVDQDTIFIGHSLGATFILSLLEKVGVRIRASFLVAGFASEVADPKGMFNEINRTFYDRKFDWKRIRGNCVDMYLINSDNDPYITLDTAERMSRPLGVRLTVVEGAGHFGTGNGYSRFPLLLEMVEDVLTTRDGA